MRTIRTVSQDFFKTALVVWVILVIMELINAGMVQRFINLEIYFYVLILVYIFNKIIDK